MSEISCIQSQQNSAAQTLQVMWLHEPSSILTMSAPQRGHAFTSASQHHTQQTTYGKKIASGWSFAPDPAEGAYDAPPDLKSDPTGSCPHTIISFGAHPGLWCPNWASQSEMSAEGDNRRRAQANEVRFQGAS